MTYNLSFLNSSSPAIQDVFVGVNDNSGGLFGLIILFVLYVILFVVYSDRDLADNLIGTTLIGGLVSAVLWGLQLVPTWTITTSFILFMGGIMYKFMTRK